MPTNTDEATKEKVGVPGGAPHWAPSAEVRSQFTDDDQRKNATFWEIYTYDDQNVPTFLTSIGCKFDGVVTNGVREFLDDYIIYRYADLLLMKAEAKNGLGQDPSDEINRLRQRAYGMNYASHVFVSGTTSENDDAILQERLLELMLEGKRWWDLIRFGKAFDLVPSLRDRQGEDYLLVFPISETTLGLNPNLTQNSGY